MTDARTFVIVGAGQAGRWLASTLRAEGFTGRIVWFGDEGHPPYERPPLSKAVLKGDVSMAQLTLLAGDKFDALNVESRFGERVARIDRAARQALTESGNVTAYDVLFLANGGRARTLPGLAASACVHTLRTFDDALALKAQLTAGRHVVVIGGGWIGLEVAASARQLGADVTLIEAAPRLCIRTVPPCVSARLQWLHEERGVSLRLGDGVRTVDLLEQRGHADAVEGSSRPHPSPLSVHLNSGERIDGDVLVVGIGLVANDTLASQAGLATDRGVLTDAHGRTDDPAVFAVGDAANPTRGAHGARMRIESWENAQRQAVAAARAALGVAHDPDADGPPWFWSDQYDDNVQLLGLPDDRMTVIERHRPASRQHLFFFCEGPRVRAVAAVNAGRDISIARKWMREDRFPELSVLGTTDLGLNKLALHAAARTT